MSIRHEIADRVVEKWHKLFLNGRYTLGEAQRLLKPDFAEREVWFQLPMANDDWFYVLVDVIKEVCNGTTRYPIFSKDRPMQIGIMIHDETPS